MRVKRFFSVFLDITCESGHLSYGQASWHNMVARRGKLADTVENIRGLVTSVPDYGTGRYGAAGRKPTERRIRRASGRGRQKSRYCALIAAVALAVAVSAALVPIMSHSDQDNRASISRVDSQTVDVLGLVGYYCEIAVNSFGNPHICHEDMANGDLKYSRFWGDTWTTYTLFSSGPTGHTPSIDIDSSDKVHISYTEYDGVEYRLKYTTDAGGSWTAYSVDSVSIAEDPSLVVDSNKKVHIAYTFVSYGDPGGIHEHGIKYATNSGGPWTTIVVDSVGYLPTIALDSNNKAHIAYSGSPGIYYATNAGGAWSANCVEAVEGHSSSVAIDSNNKVHISYVGIGDNLKYLTDSVNPPYWTGYVVDYPAVASRIAVDLDNRVHIGYNTPTGINYAIGMGQEPAWNFTTVSSSLAYMDMEIDSNCIAHFCYGGQAPDFDLFYAKVTESPVTVDAANRAGEFSSIAVDSNDKVHISYCERINYITSNLKYATNVGGYWTNQTVDDVGGLIGYYTSIAVDSNNKVHISYLDNTNGDLRYATNAGGSWATVVVDSAGFVGQFSSIAIDSNNKVHISYYDPTSPNYDLKYATNAGGSWTTEVVDSGGDVGQYSSIAVDSTDKIHITYFDVTNLDVKYATNRGGSWTTSTIVGVGNVGWTTSLAIDGGDRLHVSYYDGTNTALGYATNSSGSWQSYIVDNDGDVGGDSSLAVDSWGWVHIVYHDLTNGDLKYAQNVKRSVFSWGISTIDSAGDVGEWTSIAVDSEDSRHVSYFDASALNYNMKYVMIIEPISGYPHVEIAEFPTIVIPVLGAMLIAAMTSARRKRC